MIKVNGKEHDWREGMTITDLIKDLDDSFPYAVVRIDEKQISRPYFKTTRIPDSTEVFLIPMIAGG